MYTYNLYNIITIKYIILIRYFPKNSQVSIFLFRISRLSNIWIYQNYNVEVRTNTYIPLFSMAFV